MLMVWRVDRFYNNIAVRVYERATQMVMFGVIDYNKSVQRVERA
jgi:hypothetical protein